jgi:cob(I)alamin adenosyltransferase
MNLYRSPYEAYPFLCDRSDDLRCDFELLTDEMSSRTGLLRALVKDPALQEELLWICELIYHMNPTLRTRLTVTEQEAQRLLAAATRLKEQEQARCKLFVLTQGCEAACQAHILRVQGKQLVRLLYHWIENGNDVPDRLLDLANLLSGYFFYLALRLNELAGVEEIPYESRNYPAR